MRNFGHNGSLTRYVKLWVAHAPGMPGTFSPPPTSKDITFSACITARAEMHVGIANPRWRENVPGIPGACTTRKFTHLVRDPWTHHPRICNHASSSIVKQHHLLLFVRNRYLMQSRLVITRSNITDQSIAPHEYAPKQSQPCIKN